MSNFKIDSDQLNGPFSEVCREWRAGEISGQDAFESLRSMVDHYDFFIANQRSQIDEYINSHHFSLSDDLIFECMYLDAVILGGIQTAKKLAAMLVDDPEPQSEDRWNDLIRDWFEPEQLKAFRHSKHMGRVKPLNTYRKANAIIPHELVLETIALVTSHKDPKKMSFDSAAKSALAMYEGPKEDIKYRSLSRRARNWNKKGYR